MITPWAKLLNEILNSKPKVYDAVFAHGWGDLHQETISYLSHLSKNSKAMLILLNEAESYEKTSPGFPIWKTKLIRSGVNANKIIPIGVGTNTQEEARKLISFAKANDLVKIAIFSVPQHILRAFLTNIEVSKKLGFKGKIYPLTLKNIDWEKRITIKPLANDIEKTTRIGRFADEIARINIYREKYTSGNEDYAIASIEEGIKYIELN